jgi:hypothetical protein
MDGGRRTADGGRRTADGGGRRCLFLCNSAKMAISWLILASYILAETPSNRKERFLLIFGGFFDVFFFSF